MQFQLFDLISIVIFLALTFTIYRKAWFYSFYSFIKFFIVFVLSLIIGQLLAKYNPVSLPLTNLQIALVLDLVAFIVLWKILSFKRIFFTANRRGLNLDRFIFIHHLNRFLNIIPSVVVSLFICFFLFTVVVSASPRNRTLQLVLGRSTIVAPLAYKVYFSPLSSSVFNGTVFVRVPAFSFGAPTGLGNVKDSAILAFREKLDPERIKAGLFTMPPVTTQKGPELPKGTTEETVPQNQIVYPPSNDVSSETSVLTPTPFVIPTPTSSPVFVPPNPFIPPTPTPTYFPTPTPYIPPQQPSEPNPTPPPQAPSTPADFSSFEQDIFNLTNAERTKAGLPAFIWSNEIAAVARAHSNDMATRNFFSHINPEGLNPAQRMQIGGVKFSYSGENIAGGPTAEIIVNNWMNSPGHKANILGAQYNKIGIGVARDSNYGYVATQNFTD